MNAKMEPENTTLLNSPPTAAATVAAPAVRSLHEVRPPRDGRCDCPRFKKEISYERGHDMFLRNITTSLFVLISLGVLICVLSCFGCGGKNPPNGPVDNRVVKVFGVGNKFPRFNFNDVTDSSIGITIVGGDAANGFFDRIYWVNGRLVVLQL